MAIKLFFFVTDVFDSSLVSSMYVAYTYEQWKVLGFFLRLFSNYSDYQGACCLDGFLNIFLNHASVATSAFR